MIVTFCQKIALLAMTSCFCPTIQQNLWQQQQTTPSASDESKLEVKQNVQPLLEL